MTNFLAKDAQLIGDLLGFFEKCTVLSKHCGVYFLGNICKNWATFIFQHLVTLLKTDSVSEVVTGEH